MPRIRRSRRAVIAATAAALLGSGLTPAVAREAGSDVGKVTFRVTLTGPVDPGDAFAIWSVCPDEWCEVTPVEGSPPGRPVVACGPPRFIVDAVECSERTYEWTIELVPGPLVYRFERRRELAGDDERQLLHTGSWNVHSGSQVLTFVYDYGGGAPMLPNTAVPVP